jgi:hypothetical protein
VKRLLRENNFTAIVVTKTIDRMEQYQIESIKFGSDIFVSRRKFTEQPLDTKTYHHQISHQMVIRGYSEKKKLSANTSDAWSHADSDSDEVEIHSDTSSPRNKSPRSRGYQYYSPKQNTPKNNTSITTSVSPIRSRQRKSNSSPVSTPKSALKSPKYQDASTMNDSSRIQDAVDELYSKIRETIEKNKDTDHADVNLSVDDERVIVKFVEKKVETRSIGVNTPPRRTEVKTVSSDSSDEESRERRRHVTSPKRTNYSPRYNTPPRTSPSTPKSNNYSPRYSSPLRRDLPKYPPTPKSTTSTTTTSYNYSSSTYSSPPRTRYSSPRYASPSRSKSPARSHSPKAIDDSYRYSSPSRSNNLDFSPHRVSLSPLRRVTNAAIITKSPHKIVPNDYREPQHSPKLPKPKMEITSQYPTTENPPFPRTPSPEKRTIDRNTAEFSPRKFDHDSEYLEWQKKLILQNLELVDQHNRKRDIEERLERIDDRLRDGDRVESRYSPAHKSPSRNNRTPNKSRPHYVSGEYVHLTLHAKNLPKKDGFFGRSDPYYRILTQSYSSRDTYIEVYQSEVIENEVNPKWDMATIPSVQVIHRDLNTPVSIKVYDYDRYTKDDLLGEVDTTGHQLAECYRTGKPLTLYKKGKKAGEVSVVLFVVNDNDKLKQIASQAASRTPETRSSKPKKKRIINDTSSDSESDISVEEYPDDRKLKVVETVIKKMKEKKKRSKKVREQSPPRIVRQPSPLKPVEPSSPSTPKSPRRQVRFGDESEEEKIERTEVIQEKVEPRLQKVSRQPSPPTTPQSPTDKRVEELLRPNKNRSLSVMLHKIMDDRLKVDKDMGKIADYQLDEVIPVQPKTMEQVEHESQKVQVVDKVFANTDPLSSLAETNTFLDDSDSTSEEDDFDEQSSNDSRPTVDQRTKNIASEFLSNGMILQKFTKNGSGAPVNRFVWIDAERRAFHWAKGKKRVSKQPKELLITDVKPGIQVAIKRMNEVNQKHCFTIDTSGAKGKKIRLICPDQQTRDKWVNSIRTILDWYRQRSQRFAS